MLSRRIGNKKKLEISAALRAVHAACWRLDEEGRLVTFQGSEKPDTFVDGICGVLEGTTSQELDENQLDHVITWLELYNNVVTDNVTNHWDQKYADLAAELKRLRSRHRNAGVA